MCAKREKHLSSRSALIKQTVNYHTERIYTLESAYGYRVYSVSHVVEKNKYIHMFGWKLVQSVNKARWGEKSLHQQMLQGHKDNSVLSDQFLTELCDFSP